MNDHTRQYRVTHFQMIQFRERVSDDKRVTLHGTAERGELAIAVPFCGEILLNYRHETFGGVGQLEVTLIAAPGIVSRESIWKKIDEMIEKAQDSLPAGA